MPYASQEYTALRDRVVKEMNGGRGQRGSTRTTFVSADPGLWLNVVTLGARGNGVTDDTESIDRVLTAAAAQSATVVFPGGGRTYNITSALSSASNVSLFFYNGAKLNIGTFSIRSAAYRWEKFAFRVTLKTESNFWFSSGSGTSNYYFEQQEWPSNDQFVEPDHVYANNVQLARGTLGSLSAGQWAYGDMDSLGYDTIYIRLADSSDPDTHTDGYIQYGHDEYYLQTAAGGDPGLDEPPSVEADGVEFNHSEPVFLKPGEWGYGDATLVDNGYDTIYIRLSDEADPDSKASGYVQAGYTFTVNGDLSAGAAPIIDGTGSIKFGASQQRTVQAEWFGSLEGDATLAIQKAVFSLADGAELIIPPGDYTTSVNKWLFRLKNLDGITLRGQGAHIITAGDALLIDTCNDVVIDNLDMEREDFTTFKDSWQGFVMRSCSRVIVENCRISKYQDGLSLSAGVLGSEWIWLGRNRVEWSVQEPVICRATGLPDRTIADVVGGGGFAVVTTNSSHGLITGAVVTIYGTDHFDGTYEIEKIDSTTFRFPHGSTQTDNLIGSVKQIINRVHHYYVVDNDFSKYGADGFISKSGGDVHVIGNIWRRPLTKSPLAFTGLTCDTMSGSDLVLVHIGPNCNVSWADMYVGMYITVTSAFTNAQVTALDDTTHTLTVDTNAAATLVGAQLRVGDLEVWTEVTNNGTYTDQLIGGGIGSNDENLTGNSHYVLFDANTVDNGSYGIRVHTVDRLIIRNNHVRSITTQDGIFVSANQDMDDVLIEGNTVSDIQAGDQHAIEVKSNGFVMKTCRIMNNRLDTGQNSTKFGIYVEDVRALIVGNHIENSGKGIVLDADECLVIANVTSGLTSRAFGVTGNRNVFQANIMQQGDTSYVTGGSENRFIANTLTHETTFWAIEVEAGSVNNIFERNQIYLPIKDAGGTVLDTDGRNHIDRISRGMKEDTGSAVPTSGNWPTGSLRWKSNPAASGGSILIGWLCEAGGQYGTLTGVTANTTNGSNSVALTFGGSSTIDDLYYGAFVTISAAGITNARVLTVVGNTITLSANATSTQTGTAVAYGSNPTFVTVYAPTSAGAAAYTDEEAQDAVGAMLVDSATIDFTYTDATPALTAVVIDDSISNAKLRDSSALSVIGRSANSTGDPADIAAASDDQVLRRSGTSLGFGTVVAGGIADNAVTNAKLADMASKTYKGRTSALSGDPEDVSAANVALDLQGSITTLVNLVIAAITQTGSTGSALAVLRNLASTSTDSPVVSIVQDHTGDDQTALRVQQDGTGKILSLFDGATEVVVVEDGGFVGLGIADPTTQLHVEDDNTPGRFTRLESDPSSVLRTIIVIKAQSQAAETDGYGPRISLAIEDSDSGGEFAIAGVSAERAGADNTGALILETMSAGTLAERARIGSDGIMTIPAGIKFANETLSTYDEGTWTPAITGSSSNPTVAYTLQEGKYTRIGNIVFFSLAVTINTISGGSGTLRISLPFTAAISSSSADATRNTAVVGGVDLPGTPVSLAFSVSAGQAYGNLTTTVDNGANGAVTVADAAAGDLFRISGFFWV